MPTTADYIKKYIELRDHIETQTKAFEEAMQPYRAAQQAIEGAVTQELNELGGESIKTEHGTAYRSQIMQVKVASREDFLDFVFDGRREGFLTNSIAKDAVKEYLEMHAGQLPPGVDVTYLNKTNFRRAS
mgnify:CR=1 FL=1